MRYVPWWLYPFLTKKYKKLWDDYNWDSKTDIYIITEYQNELEWINLLESIKFEGDYLHNCHKRVDKYLLPQMIKRGLFEK